jgi:hypothetical protein
VSYFISPRRREFQSVTFDLVALDVGLARFCQPFDRGQVLRLQSSSARPVAADVGDFDR